MLAAARENIFDFKLRRAELEEQGFEVGWPGANDSPRPASAPTTPKKEPASASPQLASVRLRSYQIAESAGEGLSLAACHEIDAAVTDYQMPCRNGIEFCRALRQQNEAVDRRVPIFLMTGSLELKTGEALAAGATKDFRKPFQAIEVCNEIERHIAGAS